jgi:fatty acid desaturase
MSVEGYAQVHLRHHRYYFTHKDPDFLRKRGPEWAFPMAPSRFAELVLQDLSGLSLVKFIGNKKRFHADDGSFRRKHPSPAWLRPVFFLLAAIVLTLVHGWFVFAIYWLVPLMTVLPVIVRWGAICEHSYGHHGAGVEETSPVILPTLAGRILLPNLNFTFHPYHHYFPGVSFANLPAVHAIFEEERLVRTDQVHQGQLAYFRHIFGQARDWRGARDLGAGHGYARIFLRPHSVGE